MSIARDALTAWLVLAKASMPRGCRTDNAIARIIGILPKQLSDVKSGKQPIDASLLSEWVTLWNAGADVGSRYDVVADDREVRISRRGVPRLCPPEEVITTPYLPIDFPGVREEAERLAKTYTDLCGMSSTHKTWDELSVPYREFYTGVHQALLRDLTRPASRDWLLRQLWQQHVGGLWVGCPLWYKNDRGWVLSGIFEAEKHATAMRFTFTEKMEREHDIRVPDIERFTDPAAALLAACMFLRPRPALRIVAPGSL